MRFHSHNDAFLSFFLLSCANSNIGNHACRQVWTDPELHGNCRQKCIFNDRMLHKILWTTLRIIINDSFAISLMAYLLPMSQIQSSILKWTVFRSPPLFENKTFISSPFCLNRQSKLNNQEQLWLKCLTDPSALSVLAYFCIVVSCDVEQMFSNARSPESRTFAHNQSSNECKNSTAMFKDYTKATHIFLV